MPDYGKLLVFDVTKGQLVQEYRIPKSEVSIGREPENDLVLNHPQISRRHARLKQQGNQWILENLSQSNPVTVNGFTITGPTPLNSESEVGMGPFTFQLTSYNSEGNNPVKNFSPASQPQPGQPSSAAFQVTDRYQANLPSEFDKANSGPGTSGSNSTNPSSKGTGQVYPRQNQPDPIPSGNQNQQFNPSETVIMPGNTPVLKVAYEGVTREYPLTSSRVTIGRALENDIVVPVPTVSRLHAVLAKAGNSFTLQDQKSANGLIHKGSKINEISLKNGDTIRIGDELGNVATLTYEDLSSPENNLVEDVLLNPNLQEVKIGRNSDNTIVLNYPQVSAYHAVIRREAGGARVVDLGSTNGTFVRGQRVLPNTPVFISQGEVVQIAGYQLVYHENRIAQNDNEKVRIDALNVRKTVNHNSLVLLHDISLSIQPKEFVAVVGGSGAGKSTLMDALNGFRPATTGKVLLNGDDYYQNFAAYRSNLGYVPQEDIIHRELTVERALYYVAKLRLPKDTTDQEIEQRVGEVLQDVEMTERRKVEVLRLSGGQRKRVSIAVELLAKPNLFFLDEPTSGLDPGLDKRMMFLLRRLADQGRTIILVTHATSNISACDKVVFLAPGGKLCFYGPPQDALKFFDVKEFADIYSKLEQTPTAGDEYELLYRQSSYYQKNVTERLADIPPPAHSNPGPHHLPHTPLTPGYGAADSASQTAVPNAAKSPKVSGFRQFTILTRRYAELLRRDRINLLVLILQAPVIGLILALVAGDNIFADGKSPGDAQKVLFMLAIAAVWLGTSNAAREITKETPIYLRERLVNLRVFPYVMSKVAVLTLLCIIQSILLGGIVLLRTGVPPAGALFPAALELIIGVWLTTLGGLAMGLMVSALASNTDKATSIVPIILVPQIILAGLIFPLSGPSQILSYVTISKWSIDTLGTTSNLNRLYYQTLAGAPPGINPSSVPSLSNYEPANYDDNPDAKKDNSTSYNESRKIHLLGRWGVLLVMIIFFLGLTCYFQKRKDRVWERK